MAGVMMTIHECGLTKRRNSKRRIYGGKCTDREMVRDFLAKIHSNYFRAV